MEGRGWNPFKRKEDPAKELARKTELKAMGVGAIGIAAVEAAGALTGHSTQPHHEQMNPTPAAAPVEANNPTVGMHSTDTPPPVTVNLHSEGHSIDLGAPQTHTVDIGIVQAQHEMDDPEEGKPIPG